MTSGMGYAFQEILTLPFNADFPKDLEKNRPGQKGYRATPQKKSKKDAEDARAPRSALNTHIPRPQR